MMFHIKHQVTLDLSSTMLTHMVSFFSHGTKVTLPYGMYLTKVFQYYAVDSSNEESSKLHFTHVYKYNSYLCMSYFFDDTQKAYHWVIVGQDVYVYNRDTLAHFLLDGYSRPSGIAYNIEKVINISKGDEDIPLPSNDLMDIDPSASNSKPIRRCASTTLSTSSMKHYIQQIIASFALMDFYFTAIDGCLAKIQ